MADLSKIILPDNTTVNIRDAVVNARRWKAITQGQKWSRIYYATGTNVTTGTSGFLSISCTRGSVVCNVTFLVISSHAGSKYASCQELASNNYTPVRIRLVSNNNGQYYFEIYDTAQSIASGTTQTWDCYYIPLADTTLTPYTTFTDGSSVPSGYTALNDFTTTTAEAASAIKDITRSGTTFTATRQDGTTFTFSQQDNNTTYTLGTSGNNVTLTPSSGSANTITVPYATTAGSATDSTKMPLAGGTFTGIVTHNKSIHGSGGDTIYGAEARNSQWYKLTLATNGLTPPSSSNQWYMCSFNLNMAGDYSNTPKGSVYVSYYIYWNKSTFSADKVFATAFGNNMDKVKVYYKLTNPFILYIDSSNTYSAIWIDKISYRDSGNAYRTLDTVLETTSAITTSEYSSIPIACFYTYDGSHLYTNKSLLPDGNNTFSLGASDKKWTNGYFTNINGVAVGDSPKFTDNNTTYTFANGTNGFTVTPSGGTAQTVTVTPSITNNVTGSGTSGYIAKFNGGNTITNGPALGSSTTTYLRNDGSWQTPPNDNNKVTQTNTTTAGHYKVLLSGTADNTTRTEGANKSSKLEFNPALSNGTSIGYEFKDGTRGDWTTDQTCGLLDIAGFSSINVRLCGDGTVAAEKIICHSMYTYDISSQYTFSKSSGNWTISAIEAHRTGNVVNLAVTFKGNGSAVSAGGNGFVGTCTAGPLPLMVARGISFISSGGIVFQLDIAGNVYARVIGSSVTLASTGTSTISIVFMMND